MRSIYINNLMKEEIKMKKKKKKMYTVCHACLRDMPLSQSKTCSNNCKKEFGQAVVTPRGARGLIQGVERMDAVEDDRVPPMGLLFD